MLDGEAAAGGVSCRLHDFFSYRPARPANFERPARPAGRARPEAGPFARM